MGEWKSKLLNPVEKSGILRILQVPGRKRGRPVAFQIIQHLRCLFQRRIQLQTCRLHKAAAHRIGQHLLKRIKVARQIVNGNAVTVYLPAAVSSSV